MILRDISRVSPARWISFLDTIKMYSIHYKWRGAMREECRGVFLFLRTRNSSHAPNYATQTAASIRRHVPMVSRQTPPKTPCNAA
jgi:hypothetical protein